MRLVRTFVVSVVLAAALASGPAVLASPTTAALTVLAAGDHEISTALPADLPADAGRPTPTTDVGANVRALLAVLVANTLPLLALVGALALLLAGVLAGRLRSATRRHDRSVRELRAEVDQANQTQRAAEDANAATGTVLTTLCQEIRRPLDDIARVSGQLLETPLTMPQQQYVQRLRASSDALLAMIDDVVSCARQPGGRSEPASVAGDDLADLVAEAVAGVASPARSAVPVAAVPDLHDDASHRDRDRAVIADLPLLSGRVLVVADDADDQRLASGLLERLGCRADVVGDGAAVADVLSRLHYDALLIDCRSSGLDGWQTTRELRDRETTHGAPRLPVIGMTATAQAGERERCLAAGMDDYVTRPVDVNALAVALGRFLPSRPPADPAADAAIPLGMSTLPLPEIDRQVIDRLRGELAGDVHVLGRLLAEYVRQTDVGLTGIAAAIAAADAPGLRLAAHRFKGSSLTIGARSVADRCLRIEESALLGDIAQAATALDGLRTAVRDAVTEVDVLLREIGRERTGAWRVKRPPTAG